MTLEKSTSYFGPFAPSLPAKVRALLPTAKVVVAVCDPTVRLWNQFQSQLRAEAEAAAAAAAAGPNATANAAAAGLLTLAALNVSTFADLVALFDRPRGSYETEERRLSERALTAEFLERGYYALHLLDWYTAFGRANVLAVNTDAWQRDPAAAERDARALAAFAGLAPGGLADAAATAGAAAAAGAASAAQNATAAAAAHTKRWRSAIPEAQRELLDELYTDHNFMLTKARNASPFAFALPRSSSLAPFVLWSHACAPLPPTHTPLLRPRSSRASGSAAANRSGWGPPARK